MKFRGHTRPSIAGFGECAGARREGGGRENQEGVRGGEWIEGPSCDWVVGKRRAGDGGGNWVDRGEEIRGQSREGEAVLLGRWKKDGNRGSSMEMG